MKDATIARFIATLVLCTPAVQAQTALTGAISGTVFDTKGAVVPRAEVSIKSDSLTARQVGNTDASGRFTLLGLTPSGDYVLSVTAQQFRTATLENVNVISEQTVGVNVTLEIAPVSGSVTVTGDSSPVEITAPEVSQRVDQRRLTELPSNGRNLAKFALLDPHVRNTSGLGADGFQGTRLSFNGASFRNTRYKLDGNVNYDTEFNNAPLQTVSLSAVQEFKIVTNQFSAEYGGTSTGYIVTTTKSGTGEFHGEALFYGRPSGLQARPPLAGRHVPNELEQAGGSLGGPIVRDKTFFFANYEGSRVNRGAFIFSPTPQVFLGRDRDNLALLKLDQRFGDAHNLSVRGNFNKSTSTNPADRVAGFFQPSYAQNFLDQGAGVQLTDTATYHGYINELRANYVNALPGSTFPVVPSVGIVRPSYSTSGFSSVSSVRMEVYQLSDQVSTQIGRHSLKLGGEFIRRKVRDFSYDQFGSYRFAPGPPQPGEHPLTFTQKFGGAFLTYGQTQWAGFIQDDWRITPKFTANLGLRYEYQSVTDAYHNFGPRLGFAYDLNGHGSTIIRGGAAIYYDQPFFHGLTQKYLLDGPRALAPSYTLAFGDPGFPVFPNSLSAPPTIGLDTAPRTIDIRGKHLINPYTSQFSLGVQRQLGSGWVATADGIHSLAVKQIQSFNRNAPAPFLRTAPGQIRTVAQADATRPLKTYLGVPVRDLLESVNSGTSEYNALDLGLIKRFANRYLLEGHYVYSSALNNETDDHLGANPNEWSDVGHGERGPSQFFQRHRFVGHGLVQLPWATQLSSVIIAGSGLPVNPLTGLDNNGDTNFVDRPAYFGRNSFRGTSQTNVSISGAKNVMLGERAKLEFRAEVFNLFNNRNYYGFDSTYGNGSTPVSGFMRPQPGINNADPGRQYQFGARVTF